MAEEKAINLTLTRTGFEGAVELTLTLKNVPQYGGELACDEATKFFRWMMKSLGYEIKPLK